MPSNQRMRNTMNQTRINRRSVMKAGAAIGATLPLQAGLFGAPLSLGSAQSTQLSLFHDKSGWQEFFEQMSDLATEDIDVGFEGVPYSDTTSYQQVINSSLDSGDVPDMMTWWSGYRMEGLYQSGKLLDVSDIWRAAIDAGDIPESLAAGFTFEGAQYGIPQYASYWVMYYNKRVFDEHSIDVPTTWDDFMSACDNLKSAGITPLYATISGRWPSLIWFEEFLIRNNPDFYVDVCEGRAKYTDDVAVKAMEDWKALFDNEYFSALDIPMGEEGTGLFANGELAMMPVGTWFQQEFIAQELVPGEDYDVFILPNVNPDLDRNVMIVESGGLLIPADGKNIEASQSVIEWWMQADAQTLWGKLLGEVPYNPNSESDNPVLSGLIQTVGENEYEAYQRYWEATPPGIVENAVDELARFMLNPDQYMEVLETIQSIADEEWARRKES